MRNLHSSELKQVSGGKSSGHPAPPSNSNVHNVQKRGNRNNEHSQGEAHRADPTTKGKKRGH